MERVQTSTKQVIDMIFRPSTIAERYECLLYSHRTQRVHWMQRVIMVLMSGPIFLSSTALFSSDKRLRSDPNCMDWSWKPIAIRHGSIFAYKSIKLCKILMNVLVNHRWRESKNDSREDEVKNSARNCAESHILLRGRPGALAWRSMIMELGLKLCTCTWRSHSPPWSQMGQSSGWLANRNSITPSLQYKHTQLQHHSKQYHKGFSNHIR